MAKSGDILVVTTGGGEFYQHLVVEARAAAHCPTMQWAAPTTKKLSSPRSFVLKLRNPSLSAFPCIIFLLGTEMIISHLIMVCVV